MLAQFGVPVHGGQDDCHVLTVALLFVMQRQMARGGGAERLRGSGSYEPRMCFIMGSELKKSIECVLDVEPLFGFQCAHLLSYGAFFRAAETV